MAHFKDNNVSEDMRGQDVTKKQNYNSVQFAVSAWLMMQTQVTYQASIWPSTAQWKHHTKREVASRAG